MTSTNVRVRIAPSPTGFFHVGNARTALFNWLYAHRQGGVFICRVEDTDRTRLVEGALQDMIDSLRWLGLEPDESPFVGGPHAPYFQSQRLDRYEVHAAQLLADGHAYHCFCSPERLAKLRERRSELGSQAVYDRRCRDLDAATVTDRLRSGEPSVVRLKSPLAGTIRMHDIVRGDIEFDAAELEDLILIKSDGYPTYHLAVVVDDHAMAISHVLRGDEWIPSVPYQILLYEAFGWPQPVWAHLPMILNADGKGKLSKRKTIDAHGQPVQQMTQVREFRAAGYLPEAMFNYLALLGWAYSAADDLFGREQALARFELTDIKTSPAAWSPDKLAWMNGAYIRRLDPDDLAGRLRPFLHEAGLPADPPTVRRLVPLIQERLVTLRDAAPWVDFVWQPVQPAVSELVPTGMTLDGAKQILVAAGTALAAVAVWQAPSIEATLRALATELGLKTKAALQPIRVAASGKLVSPPLFESLAILGREATLARLAAARELLETESERA
jgi:glutamyl-tRNA synthetase